MPVDGDEALYFTGSVRASVRSKRHVRSLRGLKIRLTCVHVENNSSTFSNVSKSSSVLPPSAHCTSTLL